MPTSCQGGIVDTSVKYAVAHMYSSRRPQEWEGRKVNDGWLEDYKVWLNLRNDDLVRLVRSLERRGGRSCCRRGRRCIARDRVHRTHRRRELSGRAFDGHGPHETTTEPIAPFADQSPKTKASRARLNLSSLAANTSPFTAPGMARQLSSGLRASTGNFGTVVFKTQAGNDSLAQPPTHEQTFEMTTNCSRIRPCLFAWLATFAVAFPASANHPSASVINPNIVLVMADDQGWGQVGYNGHPLLKTPHLDAMAEAGIRLNRFYAAGPVCSPTRASVLTGRTHTRTGVPSHGHNLCLQEKTLPSALKTAGYATGHFGKWHLNGVRGAGVPIPADDPNHPGHYGFDQWLSATNYFDVDPLLSRNGKFEAFKGDSSNVVVKEALKFMTQQSASESPFLAVIWYGSPHNPQRAVDQDRRGLPEGKLADHLGEIVGIDRSIGVLRKGLRDLEIEQQTLVWYCSDNGGLDIDPDAVGSLRGHKGDLYEGGIRVPGIIEWPGHIDPHVTDFPASTMDIMPTIVDLLNLPDDSMLKVHDGESLSPLFDGHTPQRTHAIPFRFQRGGALIDGDHKLISTKTKDSNSWQLFDLNNDPRETTDLAAKLPDRFAALKSQAEAMLISVETSSQGKDYSEGKILQTPRNAFWRDLPLYEPHLETFARHGDSVQIKEKPRRKKTENATSESK